jgi:hypothetical protein
VRLDPELDRLVEAAASRTGQTKSDVIRTGVRAYCERVLNGGQEAKSLYDVLAPLLESQVPDPNAPTDLSTNKRYMEGFAAEHAGPNHR